MLTINLKAHPLCEYFLAGYLAKRDDRDNFPEGEFPAILDRYEAVFDSAIKTLGITKEALRKRPEFKFDSGDAANLESGIALLRAVEALKLDKFESIALVNPRKNNVAADLTCFRNGIKICLEVKTATKQSRGRKHLFIPDQLYEKVLEEVGKARKQLKATAAELQCTVRIFMFVVNWFEPSIYLGQSDYQTIVNKLELNNDQELDGVFFLTMMGESSLFLNEGGRCIDL